MGQEGNPLDAEATGKGGTLPEDVVEVFAVIIEDDTGAIGAGDVNDHDEDVGRGVGPEAGDGSDGR